MLQGGADRVQKDEHDDGPVPDLRLDQLLDVEAELALHALVLEDLGLFQLLRVKVLLLGLLRRLFALLLLGLEGVVDVVDVVLFRRAVPAALLHLLHLIVAAR